MGMLGLVGRGEVAKGPGSRAEGLGPILKANGRMHSPPLFPGATNVNSHPCWVQKRKTFPTPGSPSNLHLLAEDCGPCLPPASCYTPKVSLAALRSHYGHSLTLYPGQHMCFTPPPCPYTLFPRPIHLSTACSSPGIDLETPPLLLQEAHLDHSNPGNQSQHAPGTYCVPGSVLSKPLTGTSQFSSQQP